MSRKKNIINHFFLEEIVSFIDNYFSVSLFLFRLSSVTLILLLFEGLFGTDQTVGVADRLWVQLSLHGEALEAQSSLFHDPTLLPVAHGLFLDL